MNVKHSNVVMSYYRVMRCGKGYILFSETSNFFEINQKCVSYIAWKVVQTWLVSLLYSSFERSKF